MNCHILVNYCSYNNESNFRNIKININVERELLILSVFMAEIRIIL